MNQKKNLIIGGLGFIGSNLTSYLLKKGENVLVYDNNIFNSEGHKIYESELNFSFKLGDASDIFQLMKVCVEYKPDRIWHLAANSDISSVNSLSFDFDSTLKTSIALAEIIKSVSEKFEVIFSSSSAIFGDQKYPISEDLNPVRIPISTYGWMKLASEYALESAAYKAGKNIFIYRFPNIVGPNLTHGLIHDLIMKYKQRASNSIKLLGNGSQKKPYLHVNQLIDKMYSDITSRISNLVTFANLTPRDTITVAEICYIFKEIVDSDLTFEFGEAPNGWVGDVPNYSFDIKDTLTYELNISSQDSVKKAILENLKTL